MREKELPIKEYLRVKKEAIYSRVIFLLTAVTGAILSFILIHSGSRNLIFENVSIGLVVFAGVVISRPYWTKKKQYENQYPELKGMSTRGTEASGNFWGKHLIVYPAILVYMAWAFFASYHPVQNQEIIDVDLPAISTETEYSLDFPKSDSSASTSDSQGDTQSEASSVGQEEEVNK
ncbi:hypothetical protein K1J08_02505 [Streptococcus sanguinis]|uniref:hypothetical protein n=1 Tax=Streptococcus sanguinis TaxID=1305 RepID=UPI001CBDEA43|nr:hypothetical protein [Streptococcus sanguinis]MBZ2037601.1 hypothetical protein [Streptococcus sanguinis]MBZ2067734.1 hypothetical protein [Streptococcus sanguinis]MBZ2070149.1 hypothetical protein [Streptococcus sanguinis]